jgi:hypothetical protein
MREAPRDGYVWRAPAWRRIGLGLFAALLLSLPLKARAEEEAAACADPRLRLAGELPTRWIEPVARLCERFGSMKDVDPTARLLITPSEDDIVLDVSLGDGRVAVRRIHSPDDLQTMVEALTVVIPGAHDAPPPPAPSANPPPAEPPPAPPPQPERAPSLGVEIGLGLEGRASGAPVYLSAGARVHAGLRPGAWLFALLARWQPSEVPAHKPVEGFEMASTGVGFLVARRVLSTRGFAIDAGGTALLVVDTQSIETRVPDEVGSAADVRFGALVKTPIGSGAWRFAPSLDVDFAPARVGRNTQLDPELPPLPKWSVALGLGVDWMEP